MKLSLLQSEHLFFFQSALFYIDDLSQIIDEAMEKMEEALDQNRVITGLPTIMNRFALEAIGVMFLGTGYVFTKNGFIFKKGNLYSYR